MEKRGRKKKAYDRVFVLTRPLGQGLYLRVKKGEDGFEGSEMGIKSKS